MTLYSASSELLRPQRFLADAWGDLRSGARAAWPLFRSNMRARHRRAWLGYLWLLLPTVATTLIWVYVRGRGIVQLEPTRAPYAVHVLSGMVLWQVFVDALGAPLGQLSAGRQMITRTRVPHEALLLAGAIEVAVNCAARLLVLAALLAVLRVPVASTLVLVPLGIAALTLFGLALGILTVPAGLLYDDVSRALGIVTTFWFFLTPIVYRVPDAAVVRLNPVTPLLDTTRAWLLGTGHAARGFGLVTAVSAVMLAAAWLVHRLARPHVVARLG